MIDKKLSIIIVSYKNKDLLKSCLDSLYSFNDIGGSLEIIVSDNSPDMKVYDFIKENYKEVIVIHNSKNGGFGYGNNRGYEVSTGEYLLFLNPDTYLIEPIFKYCIDKFEHDKNLAAFGLRLVKPNMEKNFSYGLLDGSGIIDWVLFLNYWRADVFLEGKMFTSGANLFIQREVFEKIGCFDENIFMYYEESDILHRIQKFNENYKMSYFKEKRIVHLEGATQRYDDNAAINSYKRQLDSFKYYCEKHKLPLKKYLKKDIRLFGIRLLKYYITNDVKKINTEKRIIKLARAALNG